VAVVVNAGTRATAAAPCSTDVVWPAAAVVQVGSWRMLLAAHGLTADVAVGELRLHWKKRKSFRWKKKMGCCQQAMKKRKGNELQLAISGMHWGWLKGLAGPCLDPPS